MNAVSVFSGVEGLGLAVADVFGAHPVAFCEFEANPSKVLAARWPGVPNLGDVREAAWEDWAGVDVLHGGPPCQPTSSAGKRKGESDDRWMWPAALDAMRRVRPRWVVWENPSALLGLDDGEPFGRILGEMAAMGYVGSFGCLRASDVGCCHGRDRLFILGRLAADASGTGAGWDGRGAPGAQEPAGRSQPHQADAPRHLREDAPHAIGRAGGPADGRDVLGRRAGDAEQAGLGGGHPSADADDRADDGERARPHPRRRGEDAADAADQRHERSGGPRRRGTGPADGGDPAAAYAGDSGQPRPHVFEQRVTDAGRGIGTDWGDYASAIARHAAMLGRPAPAPVDDRGRLSAHLVEWMMAMPEGWVTDVLPRNPALKALGNAVVPPQAAAAMLLLLARVGARAAA